MKKLRYWMIFPLILVCQMIFWYGVFGLLLHPAERATTAWEILVVAVLLSGGTILWLWSWLYRHPMTTVEQRHVIICPLASNPYFDHRADDCEYTE